MSWLYRRGRTWWIGYRVDGKLIRESLETRSLPLAEKKKREHDAKHELGLLGSSGDALMKEAIDSFIAHQEKIRRDSTARGQKYQLAQFLEHVGEKRKIGKVETRHVAAFLDSLAVKPATRNRYRSAIHRFFEWARREAQLVSGANPAGDTVRAREVQLPREYLTRPEREKVLAAVAGKELEFPIAIGVFTGFRREEVLTVAWPSVDFDNRVIYARRTKSDRGRAVPLHRELEAILKPRKKKAGLVCLRADGTAWTLPAFSSQMLRLGRDLKMEKLRRTHVLRHTFGSLAAQAGVPAKQIKEWMGHSSLAVTDRYMHLAPGQRGKIDAI